MAYGMVVLVVPPVLPTFMADGGVVTTAPATPMGMQNMPMPASNTAPARQ
jgi:hypothetical protein